MLLGLIWDGSRFLRDIWNRICGVSLHQPIMADSPYGGEMRNEKTMLLSGVEEVGLDSIFIGPRIERRRPFWSYTVVAINVLVFLASVVLSISAWRTTNQSQCVFRSDLPDARSAIEYEQRTYTGALSYDPETNLVFRHKDGEREYFGPPSQEIDDAWSELLHGEFPSMTEEEAAPFLPELKRIGMTGDFHFEPDVFHSLHCLNAIRGEVSKALYNESSTHYHGTMDGEEPTVGFAFAHIEHCMDRLRQAIMCHGDLTPSPVYSWDGFGVGLGRSGEHTCRKWGPIRKWMNDRAERGKANLDFDYTGRSQPFVHSTSAGKQSRLETALSHQRAASVVDSPAGSAPSNKPCANTKFWILNQNELGGLIHEAVALKEGGVGHDLPGSMNDETAELWHSQERGDWFN